MHPVSLFSLLILVLLACTPALSRQPDPQAAPGSQQPPPPPPWEGSGLKGKLESYVSKMDGNKRPYAVCATSDSPEPKPLVILVTPGAPTDAGPSEIRFAPRAGVQGRFTKTMERSTCWRRSMM
jgi:hypothetical protein